MALSHYFMKLIPPRATFPEDMTEDEQRLMGEHAAYLREHFEAGRILAYGPVFQPGAPFGMACFHVASEQDARRIMDGDPTIKAGLNRYDVWPMRLTGSRGP
jgi:uncharacterized protein